MSPGKQGDEGRGGRFLETMRMVDPRYEGMPGTDVDADALNCPGEWAQGDGSDRAGSPSFNQTTGTFTGTPRVDDAGTVTVRVTAGGAGGHYCGDDGRAAALTSASCPASVRFGPR